ncbi:MAG: OB-fold nucleic acid binding domain-containing protein, partial [Deefgea sp.]
MQISQLPPAQQERLLKLGISSAFDLILHLPLRYEDETHLYTIADAPFGSPVLVEGEVLSCEVNYKPRKQLNARVKDASGSLVVRLMNFYPSQAQQLAVGKRVRLYGDIKHGYFGTEMV